MRRERAEQRDDVAHAFAPVDRQNQADRDAPAAVAAARAARRCLDA
jgi:hypothetical protein